MGKVKVACCVMMLLSGEGDGLEVDELGDGLLLVTGGGAVLEAEGGGEALEVADEDAMVIPAPVKYSVMLQQGAV